tara:strand:- start:1248 stop:2252 length:1005 start_codon:yes stop_codon:yes gene_type:complete
MARDIVQEAVEQAEAMKEAAYENAKSVLVNAMSTNLKAAVSEAIGDKITEDGNPKGANLNVNYDPEGLKDLEGDDLTDEGDGPAIVEAGVDEGDEYGGGKGDESRSHRDYEGDDDEEDENEGDEFGGDKGDESKSRRDYEAALEADDDEESDIDIDIDADDDEEEDIDEVLEIIEDDDDDEDVDVDVDIDDDDDEDVEEGRKMREQKIAATVKENRQLRRENRRYEKALTFLKKRIDEVNLFNARLAAASDLMRKVSLTKDEKERVIEHFDKARTVGEVKRTFRALSEGYRASNRSVKRQRVGRPNVQSVLTEDQKNQNPNQQVFDRMSELAGL